MYVLLGAVRSIESSFRASSGSSGRHLVLAPIEVGTGCHSVGLGLSVHAVCLLLMASVLPAATETLHGCS